jgi:hypothetical protein
MEGAQAYRVLVGKPEGKRQLGNLFVHNRVILKMIFKKYDGGGGVGLD